MAGLQQDTAGGYGATGGGAAGSGAARTRWLDELARRGEKRVTQLFGYEAVGPDWSVGFTAGLPEHLVYLVIAGTCRGTVAQRRVQLSAGTALWVAPRTSFHLQTSPGEQMTLYRLRLSGGASAWSDDCRVVEDAWELGPTFDALVLELGSGLDHRALRLRALLVVLFSSLFRLTDRGRRQAPLPVSQRAQIQRHVEDRLAQRPTVAELAELVGLSEDYFVRRFRRTFGAAPKTWLVRRRVQAAALRLDESDESISAVAKAFGYPDLFFFSRQFKSVMGVSPRGWRGR